MLSNVERAKLVVATDTLKKKKVQAEGALVETKSLHMSAWATYGSELCSYGMMAKERSMAEEIKRIDLHIALLNKVLMDETDPAEEQRLTQGLEATKQQIVTLTDECSQIEERLCELKFVQSILLLESDI